MLAIEKENPKRLKGVLLPPRAYARPDLDKTRLGELIDLISTIARLGELRPARSKVYSGAGVYEVFFGPVCQRRKARAAASSTRLSR